MTPILVSRWSASPLGELLLATRGQEVLALDYAGFEARMQRLLVRGHPGCPTEPGGAAPTWLTDALARYFAGELTALDALAVAFAGTAFQRAVWQTLRQIPPGETWSYGQLAQAIGHPRAVRAVGRTNGLNPVAIIAPCHRVVGADGSLTGYAGGLERKRWLLAHEAGLRQPWLPLA